MLIYITGIWNVAECHWGIDSTGRNLRLIFSLSIRSPQMRCTCCNAKWKSVSLTHFNFHFWIICRRQWNKKEGHHAWTHGRAVFQFNQVFLDQDTFCHLVDIWAILFFFHGIWTEWWKACLSRINSAHTLYKHHTKAHNLSAPTHIYIWAMSVWAIRRFILRRNLSSIQGLTCIYGTSCAI